MLKILNRFFAKLYTPCMELHNVLGCYISIYHPSSSSIQGYNQFFYENYFSVISHIKSEQNINQIISSVYFFDPNDQNIKIIEGEGKVYLPNKTYVLLDKSSIFVYDKRKLKVFVDI